MSSHSFKVNRGLTLRPQVSLPIDPSDGDVVYLTDGKVYRYIASLAVWLPSHMMGESFGFNSDAVVLASNTLTPSPDYPLLVISGTGPLNMIASPTSGEYKILINETGSNLTINHATGATAANQIYTPNGAPVIVPNNSSISVVYDNTLSKWIIAGGSGGGLAIMAITAAAINNTSLSPGIHYVVDMSALSTGTSTTVTLPAGASSLNLKVSMVGNMANGCALTIQPDGSDNIYQDGIAANTDYVMSVEGFAEFSWNNTGSSLGNCWIINEPGSASAGASVLDPNYDETFIYYTRSDFALDKKTFFGSVTGATDNVLGLGKIIFTAASQSFLSADLRGPVFINDDPIVNTAQVRLLYNVGKVDPAPEIYLSIDNGSTWWPADSTSPYNSGQFVVSDVTLAPSYVFTVSSANATVGAVYLDSASSQSFTVISTIVGATGAVMLCYGTGMPGASGTLTKVTGTGDTTIAYSASAASTLQVSGGLKVKVIASGTYLDSSFIAVSGDSELAGFGLNLCQDSTGSYAGDATFETRVITSTEASTGLITLTEVRFTPGAHQLHCNYKGHDFIAPDFIELGGGQVQFTANFFTTGDTVYFYVGYGMVNLSNAPVTINNMLSSNDTLGSVVVPSGFTLDKPYMNIPAGAVVSGVGNVSTDGAISGTGVLATTGVVLSRGTAPTQPTFDNVTVNGALSVGGALAATGLVTASAGVKLPTTGGTASTLSYYQEDDTTLASVTWNPDGAASGNSAAFAVKVTRVGRVVTLTFPVITSADPAGTTTKLSLSVAIPSWAIPADTKQFMVRTLDTTWKVGMLQVAVTTGAVSLYSSQTGAGFTNGTDVAGLGGTSITYTV